MNQNLQCRNFTLKTQRFASVPNQSASISICQLSIYWTYIAHLHKPRWQLKMKISKLYNEGHLVTS